MYGILIPVYPLCGITGITKAVRQENFTEVNSKWKDWDIFWCRF